MSEEEGDLFVVRKLGLVGFWSFEALSNQVALPCGLCGTLLVDVCKGCVAVPSGTPCNVAVIPSCSHILHHCCLSIYLAKTAGQDRSKYKCPTCRGAVDADTVQLYDVVHGTQSAGLTVK